MFDLHCKAATAIELKSNGLVAQKMTYGVEYLIVVDPFNMYIKGNSYLIKVDGKALMSDQTTFMKDTITTNDEFFNTVPIFAQILNAFYYFDRTILHIKISITADEHSKLKKMEERYANSIGAKPINTDNLKSIPKVVDKIFRNELLDKNSKLTKAERDRTIPFNVITQNTEIATKPFGQLDITSPVNDISELVTSVGDISDGEENKLKVTTVGDEAIIEEVVDETDNSTTKSTETNSTEYEAATDTATLIEPENKTESENKTEDTSNTANGNKKKALSIFKNKLVTALSAAIDKMDNAFETLDESEVNKFISDINGISSESLEKVLSEGMGIDGISKQELIEMGEELKKV